METELSIIVPVYNAENYLDQCLESLVNQTVKDIEIICVDNCSTDKSRDIIRKWADKDNRITALFNEVNIGQGGSMNRGLDISHGKYIAECDADDWVELDAYEKLLTAAFAMDCDVVRCNVYKHYNGITEAYRNVSDSICNICFNPQELDIQTQMGFYGRWCNIMAGIYKRSFIVDNDIWYRNGTEFEDNSLSFRIRSTATRYMYIADFLYHYRMDNPTSGTKTITSVDGIFEQFQNIDIYAKAKGLEPVANVWKFYIYQWALSRLTTEESRTEFLAKCREDFKGDIVAEELFNSKEDFELYKKIRGYARLGADFGNMPW